MRRNAIDPLIPLCLFSGLIGWAIVNESRSSVSVGLGLVAGYSLSGSI